MTKEANTDKSSECQRWPDSPETAYHTAAMFMQLGGNFFFGSKGERYVGTPEPAAYQPQGRHLPQLNEAMLHEQFYRDDEYRGAMKLLGYMIRSLSQSDKDLIYGMFASDPSNGIGFDFRGDLR